MKRMKKLFKWISIVLVTLLLVMIILPFAFSKKVVAEAEKIINSSINGEVKFKDPGLTFFSHFPILTLTVKDFSLSGVPGFEKDTLLKGDVLSFGLDLFSVFGDNIIIDKIYGSDLDVNIIMGRGGRNNFDIIPESDSIPEQNIEENDEVKPASNGRISISKLAFKNSRLSFTEESMDLKAVASGFNLIGNLSGSDGIFDIKCNLDAESLTVVYDSVSYVSDKRVSSLLNLKIKNEMTQFVFDGSRVRLGTLQANMSGVVDIPEKGYNIDLTFSSGSSKFKDIFSAIPEEMIALGENTTLKGLASFEVKIKDSDTPGSIGGVFATMGVQKGFIKAEEAPVPLSDIEMKGSFTMPSFSLDKATLLLEKFSFLLDNKQSSANLSLKGFENPEIKSEFSGEINLNMLTQALGLEGFKFEGNLSYKGAVDGRYDSSSGLIPVTEIEMSLQKGSVSTPYISESLNNINTSVAIKSITGKMDDLSVEVAPLEFSFADGPFYLDCKLENFNNPNYTINSRGVLNLDRIWQLFGVDNAKVKGFLNADLSLRGENLPGGAVNYENTDGNGSLGLKDFEYLSDSYKYPFRIPESTFQFEKERAILKNTRLEYGSNTISLDGYASDFINYYMGKGSVKGSLTVKSDRINLADFIAMIPLSDSLTQPSDGVIMIPERMNLFLKTDIKRVDFESLVAKNFNGEVAINDETFFINGTGVNIAGARFMLDAVYKPLSERLADVEIHARADSFDIGRAYREIPIMRELFTTAKNMDGIISMDYKINAKLDASMTPLYPSVKGKGFIRLENVNIKGLKVLGAISKATGKDSLNNPNLRAVTIRTSIENNIMKIERTRMRIFGFRPRFEGETSLDGKLNLNFRLGLPPLGIIGIPLTITGTFDNPVVEVRRGKEGDKLEEEEYEEEPEKEIK